MTTWAYLLFTSHALFPLLYLKLANKEWTHKISGTPPSELNKGRPPGLCSLPPTLPVTYCVALGSAVYPLGYLSNLVLQSSLMVFAEVLPAIIVRTRAGPATTLAPVQKTSAGAPTSNRDPGKCLRYSYPIASLLVGWDGHNTFLK